ncbi:MAG: RDD family protein [Saprospiraceae bacterium]|nr:RDD family protein [Saprospiraceae bacterium]MCC7504593.1 RDD family protein [Saprospiraceae bacterium]
MEETNFSILDVPDQAPPLRYAGFWERFVAMLIDSIILGIASNILTTIFFQTNSFTQPELDPFDEEGALASLMEFYMTLLPGMILSMVINWLYFAYMESSENQATLGKMALGLKVTDLNGGRITFARATGRHFAKYLSSLTLLIGYIMAAFTERRQALHDIVASTLVFKK